jgi:hypothetical protein
MAVSPIRFSRPIDPRAGRLLAEGKIMAEATIDPMLADTTAIQSDLSTIVPRAAERFGPKPALITAGADPGLSRAA